MATSKSKESQAQEKRLYVQSVVGRMVDPETNLDITGIANFHENTDWLKAQMAAKKIVEADPE